MYIKYPCYATINITPSLSLSFPLSLCGYIQVAITVIKIIFKINYIQLQNLNQNR